MTSMLIRDYLDIFDKIQVGKMDSINYARSAILGKNPVAYIVYNDEDSPYYLLEIVNPVYVNAQPDWMEYEHIEPMENYLKENKIVPIWNDKDETHKPKFKEIKWYDELDDLADDPSIEDDDLSYKLLKNRNITGTTVAFPLYLNTTSSTNTFTIQTV